MWDSVGWQHVWSCAVLFLPRLVTGLVVVVVFWVAGSAAQPVAQRAPGRRHMDHDLTLLLGQGAKWCLIVFGTITALGTMGIDVTALVAGLGLTGFALGFALRDIISNALSGILVILYKPFKNGDRISVTALEGTVADVNLRYTVLNAEGKRIFVPNSSLMTNPITVTLPREDESIDTRRDGDRVATSLQDGDGFSNWGTAITEQQAVQPPHSLPVPALAALAISRLK